MDKSRRAFLVFAAVAGASAFSGGVLEARAGERSGQFLPEERRLIEQYYRGGKKAKTKRLPPGLAKRGGNLPPGLQKKLERNGELPPGLQKKLEPLPVDLDRQLPRLPDSWERVIVERDIVLIDRRTNRILDIIEDVLALATGQ